MKTVIILSGGLDSTTLLYQLIANGKEVKALSFDYGQKHVVELRNAAMTCKLLGVEHKIVDLTNLTELISNSALTSDMKVPEGDYKEESMKSTVVPNRNMIMASIAIGWAVNLDYDQVALGVHAGDHAIYPDCRPEFIESLKGIAAIANFKAIDIYTPFLNLNKGDIVKIGTKLKVNYNLTRTCYQKSEEPCGKCGSCCERLEAFQLNNLIDPLIYE